MAPRLSTLKEALYVAAATGIRDIRILVDVYHLYKGGSGHDAIGLLSGDHIGIVHMNDYPADPPRETIGDTDRVFPGDGIAPMDPFLRDVHAAGYRGMLSLELFNADYGDRTPLDVAREGLEKTRAAVASALS
jgi:sugar phosphate isomerase/epimerase